MILTWWLTSDDDPLSDTGISVLFDPVILKALFIYCCWSQPVTVEFSCSLVHPLLLLVDALRGCYCYRTDICNSRTAGLRYRYLCFYRFCARSTGRLRLHGCCYVPRAFTRTLAGPSSVPQFVQRSFSPLPRVYARAHRRTRVGYRVPVCARLHAHFTLYTHVALFGCLCVAA